ncbi:hypothetical protein ACFLWA_08515 [Chloroflexota bacterium]
MGLLAGTGESVGGGTVSVVPGGIGVSVGTIAVSVGRIAVSVGRMGVSVGKPTTSVGATSVAVGGKGVSPDSIGVLVGTGVTVGKLAGVKVRVAVYKGRSVLVGGTTSRASSPDSVEQPISSTSGKVARIAHLQAEHRVALFACIIDPITSFRTAMGF